MPCYGYGTATLNSDVDFTLDMVISGYKWSDIGLLQRVDSWDLSGILNSK